MRRTAVLAVTALLLGTGGAGALALADDPSRPAPSPASAVDGLEELAAALRQGGVPCRLDPAESKPAVCRVGETTLTLRSWAGGWYSGGVRAAPAVVGPGWAVAADDPAVLLAVRRAIGGEVRSSGRGGYVPPCRVVADGDGFGTRGVHLDEQGRCPAG